MDKKEIRIMTHEQHENINKVKEVIKETKYRAEILELKRIITEIKMTLEASLVAQMVKRLSAMQETRVQPLGWEDPLEKEMAAHSSILAWKIPWIVEPGRLPSMGSQRVRYDRVTSLHFRGAQKQIRAGRKRNSTFETISLKF